MRWTALLVVAALLAPAGEAADKDRAALQGTWTVVAAEQDGQPLDRIKDNKLMISEDNFTIKTKTSELKGTMELHPDIMPKGMDLTHSEGAATGRIWYAIYSLAGDELKICYADPNPLNQRAGEFATKAGTNTLLVTLKRE